MNESGSPYQVLDWLETEAKLHGTAAMILYYHADRDEYEAVMIPHDSFFISKNESTH
jgi:hypothetical protein